MIVLCGYIPLGRARREEGFRRKRRPRLNPPSTTGCDAVKHSAARRMRASPRAKADGHETGRRSELLGSGSWSLKHVGPRSFYFFFPRLSAYGIGHGSARV